MLYTAYCQLSLTEAETLPPNPGSGGNPSRFLFRLMAVISSVSEVKNNSVKAITLYTNSCTEEREREQGKQKCMNEKRINK